MTCPTCGAEMYKFDDSFNGDYFMCVELDCNHWDRYPINKVPLLTSDEGQGSCETEKGESCAEGGSAMESLSTPNDYQALKYACEYIRESGGGCPLDLGECQFPSIVEHCEGEEENCWLHYFRHKYTRIYGRTNESL